jgi:hypothetical protein
MLHALQTWDETWSNTGHFENQYKTETSESANWVATNIDSYTTDIGWYKFDDAKEQEKYNKERSKALKERLKSTGGTGYIDDIESGIKEAGKEVEDFTDAINALASDMGIVSTKTKDLAENFEELLPALTSD